MITFEAYFDRIISLHLQFDTARKALEGFVKNSQNLEQYAAENLTDMRRILDESAKRERITPESTWAYDSDAVTRYIEATKDHAVRTLTDAQQRLRQYEFILRVAIFESFMKDVHRGILTAKPSLLKEDRQVPLGKLVAKGEKDIINEEIEREVQALDRESIKKKAAYFLEKLGITWATGIALLEITIRLRNEMLHENPDRMVQDLEHTIMQIATVFVPTLTVAQAALLYPTVCELPLKMTEEDARKMLPGRQRRRSWRWHFQ